MAIYNNWFYNGAIKKYSKVFGYLFSGIDVVTLTSSNTEEKRVRVPISYANKQKWIQRLIEDPKLERQTAMSLPRMAYEIIGVEYDAARKLSSRRNLCLVAEDENKKGRLSSPVPYNINFALYLTSKNEEDMMQMVEQILPWFTPDYTFQMKGVTNPEFGFGVPVALNSVTTQDSYEGSFEDRRVIIWTLTFTMKAYIFGPYREGNIIKHIDVTTLDSVSGAVLSDIDIEPFVEGKSLSDIEATDNYEIITTITNP